MAQYDLIIIGAGPAGMTAAIYGARADMNVLMLDKLAPGGQIINTNEIQNYTGVGTVNGAELAYQMLNTLRNLIPLPLIMPQSKKSLTMEPKR